MAEFSDISLDDKYVRDEGRIYLTGVQALVRLPLVQRRRDRATGLNSAGFISGYRGSPLGHWWKISSRVSCSRSMPAAGRGSPEKSTSRACRCCRRVQPSRLIISRLSLASVSAASAGRGHRKPAAVGQGLGACQG